ncbi:MULTISPECIES: adenylosuccinate lyase [Kitasatospora]|uniref:Adenylosuccinate lyase n=1 Tax=Kitasatospora cineracea TaxID=88074 RepID=A0A3N4R2X0_9ACTN|nr:MULTISPECIES: adenylosuccinate lyase [Kitasatospora]ROR34064.1 adenylosuccinate lyase [Kitasatospora cineracea]RPE26926.1 adenylosuccinate lyase [Kitasatospora cineracea]
MIPRFTLPEMAELFSDEARYETYVRVEILATEAQVQLGRVPAAVLDDMRAAAVPRPERVAEIQQDRDHEVLSFLTAYCEQMPESSARWVHLGMTSYDLVDTALGHTLGRAVDVLSGTAQRLRTVLVDRSFEHWDTVMVGRTHGIHAEPTTLGHKLGGFAFAVDRSLQRLAAAREAVAVGTVSGSVGTYALIDPAVEEYVCERLGLGIELSPTQVVARDRHAQLLQAVAALGSCIEQIALELRLLQRTEVREVEERRTAGYQGSSAMPHKANPTGSELLCGLARLLRGYATTALENVALWHERDLAHQAVEKVLLPDALTVAHYQAAKAVQLLENLAVDAGRMRANIAETHGLVCSSSVLVELLEAGVERDRAYRAVQAAAKRTSEYGQNFGEALREEGIEAAPREPEAFLVNHHVIHKRLEMLRDRVE